MWQKMMETLVKIRKQQELSQKEVGNRMHCQRAKVSDGTLCDLHTYSRASVIMLLDKPVSDAGKLPAAFFIDKESDEEVLANYGT